MDWKGEDEKKEVIIIRRKSRDGHGGGGHGGAWKVAYADFVTAMMALFIVLWIVGQSQQTKSAIAQYFNDPGAFETTSHHKSGILPDSQTVNPLKTGPGQEDVQASEILKLKTEGEQLAKAIGNTPAFEKLKNKVEITITKEGLRIDLVEDAEGLFFDIGSATLKPEAVSLLSVIASRIGKMPNSVALEGHTDSRPYSRLDGYTNWELSSDRANAARRVLEKNGLREGQCIAVNGFSDRRLKLPEKPLDFSNRRTSILVTFSHSKGLHEPSSPPASGPSGKGQSH